MASIVTSRLMSLETRKWLLVAVALVAIDTLIEAADVTQSLSELSAMLLPLGLDTSVISGNLKGIALLAILVTALCGAYFAWDTWRGRKWLRQGALLILAYDLFMLFANAITPASWPTMASFLLILAYCGVVFLSPARAAFADQKNRRQ